MSLFVFWERKEVVFLQEVRQSMSHIFYTKRT